MSRARRLVFPRIAALRRRGPLHADGGGAGAGIGLVHQPVQRHGAEIRIAHVLLPVRVAALEHLAEQVQLLRRIGRHRRHVELLEHVERLEHNGAARGRRRRGDHLIAAVAAAHRLQLARLEAAQILRVQHAARGAHGGDDRRRHRPLVKAVAALRRDAAQRRRQLRVAEDIPDLQRRAVRPAVKTGAGAVFFHVLAVRAQIAIEDRGDDKAFLRQADGGRQHPGRGHRAPALKRAQQPGGVAGDGHSLAAADVLLVRGAAVRQHAVHRGRSAARRRLAEIEKPAVAGLHGAEHQKAAAAETVGVRLADAEREADGHRRIDGVAARGEDLPPGAARLPAPGRDHAGSALRAAAGAKHLAPLVKGTKGHDITSFHAIWLMLSC